MNAGIGWIQKALEYGNNTIQFDLLFYISNLYNFKCKRGSETLYCKISRQYKILSESEDGSKSNPLTTVLEFDPASPTELTLGKHDG